MVHQGLWFVLHCPTHTQGAIDSHPDPAQHLPSPWLWSLVNSDVLLTPVLYKHMLRKEFQLYPHLATCAETADGLHPYGAQTTSGAGVDGRCGKTNKEKLPKFDINVLLEKVHENHARCHTPSFVL